MAGITEFTQSFFQESSNAWKKNKVKYDQACYTYKKTAFKGQEHLPCSPVSKETLAINAKEFQRRVCLQEEAPLPVRKSARLKAQHNRETYSNLG